MDQNIGKILNDRYELLDVLGVGGMAVVYKAKCHRLNRLVAVKVLKPELAADADIRARFHGESKAVGMMSHPNIVNVYDVNQDGDIDYFVMELVDGITLKQYIHRRGGVLNWREALHFSVQILEGLDHAHSRGIIHRDVKPQNIMVLRDGSVKVADFGIATIADAQKTMTQEALGSVHYISPEQAKGSAVDERSDLYSTGVVLYEMLTGRLPYEGIPRWRWPSSTSTPSPLPQGAEPGHPGGHGADHHEGHGPGPGPALPQRQGDAGGPGDLPAQAQHGL